MSFIPLKDYRGPKQILGSILKNTKICFRAIAKADVVLMRSGNVGLLLWCCLKFKKRPYAVEHGGILIESIEYANQLDSSWANRLFARIMHKLHVLQAKGAACGSYVCNYLKDLYPVNDLAKQFVFSGVQLKEDIFKEPRIEEDFIGTPSLVSVGRLMPEKGHKGLIDAFRILKENYSGKIKLNIAGDGDELENLRKYVNKIGLSDNVALPGRISWGGELFKLLDSSWLFVIPSLTEGMPRALIEAMARGLPAVGTNVGGIPEILSKDCIVAKDDPRKLADKILLLLNDKRKLSELSKANFLKSKEYKPEVMQKIKNDFWECLVQSANMKE